MLNNKGFTVIELIMSFLFTSLLAISLFSAIVMYKSKQINSAIEAELIAFKSQLIMDIQEDIQLRGLKEINNCEANSEEVNAGETIHPRCVVITFNDNTSKTFSILSYTKEDTIVNKDGTISHFPYYVPYLIYGDIRYNIPDAENVSVQNDFILQTSSVYDGLESSTKLYKINFNLEHNDLDTNINISIVANGTQTVSTSENQYRQLNVGEQVNVQVKDNTIRKFRVIKNSNKYAKDVILLYDDSIAIDGITSPSIFNALGELSNQYEGSSIKNTIDSLKISWKYADEVRLINVDEVLRITPLCPNFKKVDSQDVSLASAPSWLTSTSFWTMSPKELSGNDNGKKVWYINSSSNTLSSDFVNISHVIRPVIVIRKDYILN